MFAVLYHHSHARRALCRTACHTACWLIGCLALLLLSAAPVLAQAGPAAAITGTNTTTNAAAPTAAPITTAVAPVNSTNLLTLVVVFALLALAIVFVYTYSIQREYYRTSQGLGRLGRAVQVKSVPAFVPAGAALEVAGDAADGAVEQLEMRGTASTVVGQESSEFSVVRVADGAPATDAVWSVDPATAAVVTPQQGAKVRIVAATPGVFTVIAGVSSPKLGSAQLQVAAVAAQDNAVQLPFVGEAYGSIAIAIILIAAIIILAMIGVLSGEGVATLLGALLGYIFGVARLGANKPTGGEG